MSHSSPNPPHNENQPNPFAEQGHSPFAPGYVNPYAPTGHERRIEDDPAMRWVLPVGTSGWAIASGYLGLFSAICFPAPLALLCSVIAIWHLRKNPGLSGWPRAIFGLVMGLLGTAGLTLMLIALALGK